MASTIYFINQEPLNKNLNTLFGKLGNPRIKKWYAVIGSNVYFVRRDLPSVTTKNLKNTPKGKVIPVQYNWMVSNELYYSNRADKREILKKGKDIFGQKVNVASM